MKRQGRTAYDELARLSASSPEHREVLQRMQGFNWLGHIAKSLQNGDLSTNIG